VIRAAVYARISSDPLDTGLGVQRQLKDCAELASRLGWTVVEEFIDNDTSATSGEPRPRYEAMMAALRQGRLAALVVWDVDRLTRTPPGSGGRCRPGRAASCSARQRGWGG